MAGQIVPWPVDTNNVLLTALREHHDERYRAAVEKCKEQIRRQRWWHKLFPFSITITRRHHV